jgi:hypothetical protein
MTQPSSKPGTSRFLTPVFSPFVKRVKVHSEGSGQSSSGLTPSAVIPSIGKFLALATIATVNPLANGPSPARLIGVEKVNSGFHPAAAGRSIGAPREAAVTRQRIVTTPSDDLLNCFNVETVPLPIVRTADRHREIGSAYIASCESSRVHLFTAANILRLNPLEVDRTPHRPIDRIHKINRCFAAS